ncbi:Ku protein [Devosia sp.]|uniref:non-homologous end joining protein Ku n=1 Tax=Devosia sp. TaxID=1871048 RepID=UPI003A90F8BC
MPAVSRPIWKGQLRLSLVSIAVELFTATRASARPSFRQIHAPSGKRVHYEKVAEGVGPVDKDDIKKGYEYEKGEYVLLEDEELDAIKLETRKTLELVQFVEECEIPPLYFDSPYFISPADDLAEDAFCVIRDALRATKRVGLGQLALRGKEYLVCVKPSGKGLLLETLHYDTELREPGPYFSDISTKAPDAELVDVATALIEKKTAEFDPAKFKDHYQVALKELLAEKLKSKKQRVSIDEDDKPRETTGGNVVDLMAALKKSLEGSDAKPGSKASRARTARSSSKSASTKSTSSRGTTKKPAAKTTTPRRKAS